MIMTRHRGGSLLVVPLAIVTEAQKVLLVATMTARCNVALQTTQLTSLRGTAGGAASNRPVATRDGWRIAARGRL